jgi:hypothetical protein
MSAFKCHIQNCNATSVELHSTPVKIAGQVGISYLTCSNGHFLGAATPTGGIERELKELCGILKQINSRLVTK